MTEIRELLDTARFHIDGQMDCHTPAYHALDHLERAVCALVDKVEAADKAATKAANTASCLANGIIPD